MKFPGLHLFHMAEKNIRGGELILQRSGSGCTIVTDQCGSGCTIVTNVSAIAVLVLQSICL
jgi:hypothetical protein